MTISGRVSSIIDFIIEPFEYKTNKSTAKLSIEFSRKGHIYFPDRTAELTVRKNIDIMSKQPAIEANYTLENHSDFELGFVFGVEFNWSMLAGDAPDRYYYINNHDLKNNRMVSRGETPDVDIFGLKDDYHKLDISFRLSEPCRLWRFPIETVSMSEYGFERVYQSSVTCPCFEMKIPAGESHQLKFVIRFLDM